LTSDALYLWTLLDIIGTNTLTERGIREKFQDCVLDELNIQIGSNCLSSREKRNALTVAKRIRSWEKADIYLEHITLPRLNWLLDLDLLDTECFQQRLIKLTDSGRKLLLTLTRFYQFTSEKSTVINFILEKSYFRIVDFIYDLGCTNLSGSDTDAIEQYILESFLYFKTAAPNSIAASQAIFYSCYKSLLERHCIVEVENMKKLLLGQHFPAYGLDWYKRENDGSLQRRK